MDILTVFSIVGLVVSAGLALFSQLPKETIKNQKDLIDAQEKRLQSLEASDEEKSKQITILTSQVAVLATLPLADIAAAIKEMVHTQKEIIQLIKEK